MIRHAGQKIGVSMTDKTGATDAVILSKPVYVKYTCPHCDCEIIEPFSNFDDEIWYGDYVITCPECDTALMLENVECE